MWYNRAMDIRLARLMEAMVVYDRGDARRIEHFVKVHDFAATIGTLEGLPAHDVAVLEEAAILHDVGIHVSEREHGGNNGKHQELYGPDEAEKVMRSVGCFSQDEIEQVRFLIAHHHTYTHISTLSWQILVEADFLVNLYEVRYVRRWSRPPPDSVCSTRSSRIPGRKSSKACSLLLRTAISDGLGKFSSQCRTKDDDCSDALGGGHGLL